MTSFSKHPKCTEGAPGKAGNAEASVDFSYTDAKKLPLRTEKPLILKDFQSGFVNCL